MSWIAALLLTLPSITFLTIGYLVRFRKAYWLISGYNTMPAAKKKNVDTARLGILMGNMCFILGAIIFAGILLLEIGQAAIGLIVLGGEIPVIIYTLIAAQKYDGNNFDAAGRMKKSARIVVGSIVAGLVLLFAVVGNLIYQGFQPVKIMIQGEYLSIEGSYGQTIPLADIQAVELLDHLPVVELRTNGSAIGDNLRGHFRLRDVGPAMLYLDRSLPPFITIRTAGKIIFLNLETAGQTQLLYNQLNTAVTSGGMP